MKSVSLLLILAFVSNAVRAADPPNPCVAGGQQQFFSHSQADNKFIQCSSFGQMFVFTCPQGLKWDQATSSCQLPKNIKSLGTSQQPAATATASFNAVASTNTIKAAAQQQQPVQPQQSQVQQPVAAPVQPQVQPVVQQQQQVQSVVQQQPVAQQAAPDLTQIPVDNSFISQQSTFVASHQPSTSVKAPTNGFCKKINIQNSGIPLGKKRRIFKNKYIILFAVNGIYGQIATSDSLPIYRRFDHINLPGVIALVGQFWCITYSFSLTDLSTLTSAAVSKACGDNLECCMLVSSLSDATTGDLVDSKRSWTVNLLQNMGAKDTSTMNCLNDNLGKKRHKVVE